MPQEVRNQSGGHVEQDFWDKWASSTPRMAFCVKITQASRWGGSVIGFTSNSRNMTLTAHPGVTFRATAAITPTTVDQQFDLASVLEVTGVYDSVVFTQDHILEGRWAGATVEVFSVCWDDETLGEVVWHKGGMGDFKDYQTFFNAESRGQLARFNTISSTKTTKNCRALREGGFRGTKCGHTASTVNIDGTLHPISFLSETVGGDSHTLWMDLSAPAFAGAEYDYPLNFFKSGKVTTDAGYYGFAISRPIVFSTARSGGLVKITLGSRFPIGVDEDLLVTAGCTGTQDDCIKYGNIENRRAEDFIPTLEAANRVPDGR